MKQLIIDISKMNIKQLNLLLSTLNLFSDSQLNKDEKLDVYIDKTTLEKLQKWRKGK